MFSKGDILKVSRLLYYHYGVYVGDGRVIHFSAPEGMSETDPFSADIFEVTLSEFSKGEMPFVDNRCRPSFSPDEIVERARMMLGTQRGNYNLFGNNCEHFANWCKTGQTMSFQSQSVSSIIKELSAPLGGFADIFENVRSDIGQACYDNILKSKYVRGSISNRKYLS